MRITTHTKRNVTVALTAVIFFFFFACSQNNTKTTIEGFDNRALVPDLDVTDVITIISDSGVTRYRIQSPRWLIYNKAQSPYWYFPQGIKLEDFDQNMKVFAHLQANKARYDYNNQIWRLEGKVEATNANGEEFRTPRLFWNQKTEIVYSDTTIEVKSNGTVLKGTGFLSNQTMTKYTVKNPQGYTNNNGEQTKNGTSTLLPKTTAPTDTTPKTTTDTPQKATAVPTPAHATVLPPNVKFQKPLQTKGPAANRPTPKM